MRADDSNTSTERKGESGLGGEIRRDEVLLALRRGSGVAIQLGMRISFPDARPEPIHGMGVTYVMSALAVEAR